MKYRDYYEILGVTKDASQENIKKAFRTLAKKYHPDSTLNIRNSDEKFKEINEAYEVLGDAEKRRKYDELGNQASFQNGDDFDPGQAGFNSYKYQQGASSSNDFSDFFNAFFGGTSNTMNDFFGGKTKSGKRYSKSFGRAGSDSEAEISISPEDGFHGHEMRVSFKIDASERTISFKIPPGIKPGEKIKLSGQGEQGINGGKNGDLFIRVNFIEDGKLKLNGLDLEMGLDLMPWDAALGSETTVAIIDDTILLKTPPGIQTGSKIRVAGKGYKDRSGKRGDLYIQIRIMNPKVINDDLKELYLKMKQLKK